MVLRLKILAATIFSLCTTISYANLNDALLVSTSSGKVQGFLDTTTTHVALQKWYGIRFAEDTSGANRWRPPKPFFGSEGIFNASAFGPACLQGRANGGNGTEVQSEDCLRVNVIAPKGTKNLPVYIYS